MNYPLPEAIGTNKFFVWGPVVKIHKIEALEISIVEYKETDGEHRFHPYVKGEDTSVGCNTLEEAIIWSLSVRSVGPTRTFNHNHPYFACRVLEFPGYC